MAAVWAGVFRDVSTCVLYYHARIGRGFASQGAGQMNVLFLIPLAMIALWLIAQLWNLGRS